MSAVIIVATAFPIPEHRDEVIAAFEAAIAQVHEEEPGTELYALHEGPDRLEPLVGHRLITTFVLIRR